MFLKGVCCILAMSSNPFFFNQKCVKFAICGPCCCLCSVIQIGHCWGYVIFKCCHRRQLLVLAVGSEEAHFNILKLSFVTDFFCFFMFWCDNCLKTPLRSPAECVLINHQLLPHSLRADSKHPSLYRMNVNGIRWTFSGLLILLISHTQRFFP